MFNVPLIGLIGGSVLSALEIMDDSVGLGGLGMIGMLMLSLHMNLVTMNSTAYLSVNGKDIKTRVRMPDHSVLEKIIKESPLPIDYAILQHVAQDASIAVHKLPEM
jgi:hypothetical protein